MVNKMLIFHRDICLGCMCSILFYHLWLHEVYILSFDLMVFIDVSQDSGVWGVGISNTILLFSIPQLLGTYDMIPTNE